MYVLHNLHVHPSGFHTFTFVLNTFNDLSSLMESGYNSQVFGPLNYNVSVPQLTVRTLCVDHILLFLKLYLLWTSLKIQVIITGEIPFLTLYISVASFCKFL